MKAAKSDLAKRLLADPSVRVQIRHSVSGQILSSDAVGDDPRPPRESVVIERGGRRYARVVVPKAA